MSIDRNDYRAMAAHARSLLEAGKSQEDVLRSCYGVEFPAETFALAEMIAEGREPNVVYTNLPWNLLIPLDHGGPPGEPDDLMESQERRVSKLDPSLVPLLILYGNHYERGGAMLCYRLEELAAGRSTIFGFQRALPDGVAKLYGDSLAAVIRASDADRLQRLENEFASPGNYGGGALDIHELEDARENLATADELIRRVAERRRPKLVL
jgi:hypothetical protein